MIGLIPNALAAHAAFAAYLPQIAQLDSALLEAVVAVEPVVGWAPRARQGSAKHAIQQHKITAGTGGPPDAALFGSCATILTPTLSNGETGQVRQIVPSLVSPPARALSAIDFERRVVERNELVVRPGSLHDLLNALVWLTFPKTKRAISEAHVALGVNADGVPRRGAAPHRRPRRRDVLTVFDESGMIVVSERGDLREMNRTHQWRELFVTHRGDFIEQARPVLFGHGSMEQLGNQLPRVHPGLTVKALWLPLPVATPLAELDDYLSRRIQRGESLHDTERTVPMPVLGIPGWFAANEVPACYDDASVFRPKRRYVK